MSTFGAQRHVNALQTMLKEHQADGVLLHGTKKSVPAEGIAAWFLEVRNRFSNVRLTLSHLMLEARADHHKPVYTLLAIEEKGDKCFMVYPAQETHNVFQYKTGQNGQAVYVSAVQCVDIEYAEEGVITIGKIKREGIVASPGVNPPGRELLLIVAPCVTTSKQSMHTSHVLCDVDNSIKDVIGFATATARVVGMYPDAGCDVFTALAHGGLSSVFTKARTGFFHDGKAAPLKKRKLARRKPVPWQTLPGWPSSERVVV